MFNHSTVSFLLRLFFPLHLIHQSPGIICIYSNIFILLTLLYLQLATGELLHIFHMTELKYCIFAEAFCDMLADSKPLILPAQKS